MWHDHVTSIDHRTFSWPVCRPERKVCQRGVAGMGARCCPVAVCDPSYDPTWLLQCCHECMGARLDRGGLQGWVLGAALWQSVTLAITPPGCCSAAMGAMRFAGRRLPSTSCMCSRSEKRTRLALCFGPLIAWCCSCCCFGSFCSFAASSFSCMVSPQPCTDAVLRWPGQDGCVGGKWIWFFPFSL